MLGLDLTWPRLCVAIQFAGATASDSRPAIGGNWLWRSKEWSVGLAGRDGASFSKANGDYIWGDRTSGNGPNDPFLKVCYAVADEPSYHREPGRAARQHRAFGCARYGPRRRHGRSR